MSDLDKLVAIALGASCIVAALAGFAAFRLLGI